MLTHIQGCEENLFTNNPPLDENMFTNNPPLDESM